jgi:hypothetical protein
MKLCIQCLTICVLLVQATHAAVLLDQEVATYPDVGSTNYDLDYPGDYMAQTFTVNHTGQLVGVGLQVSLSGFGYATYHETPIDDLHVKLVRTDSTGAPVIGNVLAEATIGRSSLPVASQPGPFSELDLSSWHVHVATGDQLAVVLSSNQTYYIMPHVGTDYIWYLNVHDVLPGGEFSIYSPKLYGPAPLTNYYISGDDRTIDAAYRVFIDAVPEPASISLATIAVLLYAVSRKRVA